MRKPKLKKPKMKNRSVRFREDQLSDAKKYKVDISKTCREALDEEITIARENLSR